jgi:uroporphyrin-III C-methyltransferase / precorrin-2 dehydrogenase / sirohydrochlorin ferrochelatase
VNGGFVYLVGAGPGDPRLLTLRAFELLRSAEVVAHDELVSTAILALVPVDSELLRVGHRSGHGRVVPGLHPLVLERERSGRKVIRLKCGDPMVFGEQTRRTAEMLGVRRIAQSIEDTIDSLVETVVDTLAAGSARRVFCTATSDMIETGCSSWTTP